MMLTLNAFCRQWEDLRVTLSVHIKSMEHLPAFVAAAGESLNPSLNAEPAPIAVDVQFASYYIP